MDIPGEKKRAFGNTPSRTVLVRDPGQQRILAIFTTDTDSTVEAIAERYANRWPIETAIAAGKQILGIGQARNRLQRAVERTVPCPNFIEATSRSSLIMPTSSGGIPCATTTIAPRSA